VVARVAPAGMPVREFSRLILGAAWPQADPSDWQTAADAQYAKGSQLVHASDHLKDEAKRMSRNQSGKAIDGYAERLLREAAKKSAEADKRFAMSRAIGEISRVYYGVREDLDKIDHDAHQKINEIRQSAETFATQLAMWQAIETTVSDAAVNAKAKDVEAANAITKHGKQIGIGGGPVTDSDESGGLVLDPSQVNGGGGLGGRPGPGGMPQAKPGLGPIPDSPVLQDGDGIKSHRGDGLGADHDDTGTGIHGDVRDKGPGTGGSPAPRDKRGRDLLPDQGFGPSLPLPVGGGIGGGGSSPLSPGSSGLSGVKMPDTSALSGMGGVPPGLSPVAGISPGNAGVVPPPAVPPASSGFSQGLGAGLGGAPPTPLAPPMNSPTPATSAAPTGGVSAVPASTSAAAGTQFSVPPMASPAGAGAGTSGGAASIGALPPFGSDVRSTSAGTGPPLGGGSAVAPASGSAPSVSVSADRGGSPAGPVALPPGVVDAGVGAGTGATTEAIRSAQPDPLLESASGLVYQLVHASRVHGIFLDWCVGMFRTRSGVRTVIVNNEGAACIPRGVFVPRAARMLFADPGLPPEFRAHWFSWANPAETMLAFARWAGDGADLWALAVSTANGGSAVPALAAGVPHAEDCPMSASTIPADAPVMSLDGDHQHRLETIDPRLYARMTGVEGRRPDQSEALRTTKEAAQAALSRAGALPDLAVPSAIRDVLDVIGRANQVSPEQWAALRNAGLDMTGFSAGLRPGLVLNDSPASPHALAYHDLTRLVELLLLWDLTNDADGPTMKYPEIAYVARQILDTPWSLAGAQT